MAKKSKAGKPAKVKAEKPAKEKKDNSRLGETEKGFYKEENGEFNVYRKVGEGIEPELHATCTTEKRAEATLKAIKI